MLATNKNHVNPDIALIMRRIGIKVLTESRNSRRADFIINRLQTHYWPGCTAIVKMDEQEKSLLIIDVILHHPNNPIIIMFHQLHEKLEPHISLMGLWQASNRDIQKVLPVIKRLRAGMDLTKPTTADYDWAFERIQAGEDPADVKSEFLAATSGSSETYNSAMYWRRERQK